MDLKVQMDYTQDRLDVKTAKFAAGYDAVCLFVNDTADAETIYVLSMCGVSPAKLIIVMILNILQTVHLIIFLFCLYSFLVLLVGQNDCHALRWI